MALDHQPDRSALLAALDLQIPLLGFYDAPDLETFAPLGGTDVAMRHDLPAGVLAFTVTVPMFAQLCALGPDGFVGKGFLRRLRKARGGSPAAS